MQRYALGSFGTSETIANTKKIEKGDVIGVFTGISKKYNKKLIDMTNIFLFFNIYLIRYGQ